MDLFQLCLMMKNKEPPNLTEATCRMQPSSITQEERPHKILSSSPWIQKKVVTQVDPTKQERRAVAVGDGDGRGGGGEAADVTGALELAAVERDLLGAGGREHDGVHAFRSRHHAFRSIAAFSSAMRALRRRGHESITSGASGRPLANIGGVGEP